MVVGKAFQPSVQGTFPRETRIYPHSRKGVEH
jgi:hypothetical protein